MVEQFQIADWILAGLIVVSAVMGAFRGFSGTLAFAVAAVAAAFVGIFGWKCSVDFTDVVWMRGCGTLIATLLAFGIVRIVVKKLVNGLLSQPSDFLLGFAVGVLLGVLVIVAWAWSGLYTEFSFLVGKASGMLFNT